MKLTGCLYDVEGLDGYVGEVREAVVTADRIALDWEEEGDPFHAVLRSTDGGTNFAGTFGSPSPEAGYIMEAQRFTAKNGDVLLWVTWRRKDTGDEGDCLIHLAKEWD